MGKLKNADFSFRKDYVRLLKDVCLFKPLKCIAALILMIIVGMLNGVELAVLMPLLQTIGIGSNETRGNFLSDLFIAVFNSVGLQPSLVGCLLFFFIVFLTTSILQYLQTRFSSELSHEYSAYIRGRLYDNLFNAQWMFFVNNKLAQSANIMTTESQRMRVALDTLNRIIVDMFITTAYVAFSCLISWQITTASLVAGACILLLMRKVISSGETTGRKITDANNEIQSAVWEHLSNAKIIKSHAAERQTSRIFSKFVTHGANLYIEYLVNNAKIKAIFAPTSIAMLCFGLYYGITFMYMSSSHILVLLLIFYRLSAKIAAMQQDYQQLLNAIPAYNALISLEEKAKSIPEYLEGKKPIPSFEKGITLEKVTFAYQAENRMIIQDASIFIPCGKTIALVGESGAGKSTLADLVMGLLPPTNGKIFIDDINLQDLDLKSWRSFIGYVTQDVVLFHDSVRANLLWANPDADENEIATALKVAAADTFINGLPDGLDTVVGDRGIRLSGGQRQRLALARALLRKPKLLILDEATSSLDAESESRIQGAIEALHGRMTMLVITHRLATVRNADLIYIIENGRLVESGSWESLIGNKSTYFMKICNLQGITP